MIAGFLGADDSSFDSEDEELAEAAIAEWLSGRNSVTMEAFPQDGAGTSSDSDASAQEAQLAQPSVTSKTVQQASSEAAAEMKATELQPSKPAFLPAADHLKSSPASEHVHKAQQVSADPTPGAGKLPAARNSALEPVPAADESPSTAEAVQPPEQTQVQAVELQTYANAVELEQLGLDNLKQQLQLHGLKCGGNLTERAARLFLLKDTSLSNLEKKHFPKGKK